MEARVLSPAVPPPKPNETARLLRRWLRNPAGLFGLLLVILMVIVAVFAPWIAPHNPTEQELTRILVPAVWQPGGSWEYPLGTDFLGRDLFSRVIYGSRVSLIVAGGTVTLQGLIGITLGLVAGYKGGLVDRVLMRLVDIQLAIPPLVLAMAVMLVLGPGLRNTILVLGITGWVSYARVVRGEVMAVKSKDFVEAARAVGNRDLPIMLRHVLPNVTASMIVVATLQAARMIISEASLSFLGLGVQPPTPAWGSMVAEARNYIFTHWWLAALPGTGIFLTSLGINLTGDALRDTLDPTLRGSR